MASFTFVFNKPDKKYKPGDTIHCQVQVIVSSTFKARSLSVRFKGVKHTQWTKSRTENYGNTKETVVDRYTGHELQFANFQYIFGDRSAINEREILAGTYRYDVSFILPANLPSRSF